MFTADKSTTMHIFRLSAVKGTMMRMFHVELSTMKMPQVPNSQTVWIAAPIVRAARTFLQKPQATVTWFSLNLKERIAVKMCMSSTATAT